MRFSWFSFFVFKISPLNCSYGGPIKALRNNFFQEMIFIHSCRLSVYQHGSAQWLWEVRYWEPHEGALANVSQEIPDGWVRGTPAAGVTGGESGLCHRCQPPCQSGGGRVGPLPPGHTWHWSWCLNNEIQTEKIKSKKLIIPTNFCKLKKIGKN